jgi:hypothetical protein
MTRTRSVVVTASHGGKVCRNRVHVGKCNTSKCPVHCAMSSLTGWDTCTKTCGGGWRKRTRSVLVQPKYGGKACLSRKIYKRCSTFACPVDCRVSTWTTWSACTHTCTAAGAVGAKHQRRRGIVEPAMNGGKACPPLHEARECATRKCPQHCVHKWGAWSACTKTCGGGSATRKIKKIMQKGAFGGRKCPAKKQSKPCNSYTCPVDCVYSPWAAYGKCSRSCNGGKKIKSRSVISEPKFGGKSCSSTRSATKCNTFRCPTDCLASTWLSWSACSADCGGGVQSKTRAVVVGSSHGGVACPEMIQIRSCTEHHCPVHCKYTWSAWSKCTKSCASGIQRRYAQALNRGDVKNGGQKCPEREERVCNKASCPTDSPTQRPTLEPTATVAPTKWPTGSPTTAKPTHKPTLAPTARPTSPPDVDCQVTDFSEWTPCSQKCGGGIRKRERLVVRKTAFGGELCPALYQVKNCNTQSCAKPCDGATWAAWTPCTATCGGGTSKRRAIKTKRGCPKTEEKVCNNQSCPKRRCENIVGGHKCSHVYCKAFKRVGHPLTLRVQHHHKEEKGENHCCAFDDLTNTCSCVCY